MRSRYLGPRSSNASIVLLTRVIVCLLPYYPDHKGSEEIASWMPRCLRSQRMPQLCCRISQCLCWCPAAARPGPWCTDLMCLCDGHNTFSPQFSLIVWLCFTLFALQCTAHCLVSEATWPSRGTRIHLQDFVFSPVGFPFENKTAK
jgi:hypothetical protein